MTDNRGAGEPAVLVVADADAAALAAAERIAAALRTAVDARGVAHFATTGGSTPAAIYRLLAATELRDTVPWPRVQLWWSDDRFVPRDHPLSNVRIADQALLGSAGVPIPAAGVHPIECDHAIEAGDGPEACATRYEAELRRLVPFEGPWPVFDLALLGVGSDGHLMSVFPGSPAFDSPAVALAIPAPTHVEPHVERVTLNPAILDVAREVIVVVTGAGKAGVVADLLGPDRDEQRLPAQRARRAGATWIIDAAAAANLPAPTQPTPR